MKRIAILSAALIAVTAGAAGKAKKPPSDTSKMKPDLNLNMGSFGSLPTDEKLDKPKAEKVGDLKQGEDNATYEVTKVVHGHAFTRSPAGANVQGGEMTEIPISGNPPSTDKFITMIRVHSKARDNVPIEVAVVDPRGDTVMSSSGTVHFQGNKQDDVDYEIDWDPTPLRGGGTYKFLVRVANEVKGTFPINFVEKK